MNIEEAIELNSNGWAIWFDGDKHDVVLKLED